MPVTEDINVFIKRYKYGLYNVPTRNTVSPPVTPVHSPTISTSIPQLFVKTSIDSLLIGDIVKYNQNNKHMICKVIKSHRQKNHSVKLMEAYTMGYLYHQINQT